LVIYTTVNQYNYQSVTVYVVDYLYVFTYVDL